MRDVCVVCSGSIAQLYTVPNMPITVAPTNEPIDSDQFRDMVVCVCESCGCVQLASLVDPTILYSNPHNGTAESPMWASHHDLFVRFVLESGVESITEIGGSSGAFFNRLPANVSYKCIDLCPPSDPRIPYEHSNSETHDFTGTNCIVMSHVFEHLYEPMRFIESIAKANVNTVLLSIPNMNALLDAGSCSVVFNEHTYFVDTVASQWMFSRHQYRLVESKEYNTHSVFLRFQRDTTTPLLSLTNRQFISVRMKELYETMYQRFQGRSIRPDSFFVPAGHMGQLLYTVTKPPSLIGFLDNDRFKQGYRVYGTPYSVYSLGVLKEFPTASVYLYAGSYTNELIAQLRSIQPTVEVVIL